MDDLKNVSQSCVSWFNLTKDIFLNRARLNFRDVEFTTSKPPVEYFINSMREYNSVELSKVTFGPIDHIWPKLSESLKELIIKSCKDTQEILSIIKQLAGLEKIDVEFSGFPWMKISSQLLISNRKIKLFHVKKLNLNLNYYLRLPITKNQLTEFLDYFPNVEEFKLCHCTYLGLDNELINVIIDFLRKLRFQIKKLELIVRREFMERVLDVHFVNLEYFTLKHVVVNEELLMKMNNFLKNSVNLKEHCIGI